MYKIRIIKYNTWKAIWSLLNRTPKISRSQLWQRTPPCHINTLLGMHNLMIVTAKWHSDSSYGHRNHVKLFIKVVILASGFKQPIIFINICVSKHEITCHNPSAKNWPRINIGLASWDGRFSCRTPKSNKTWSIISWGKELTISMKYQVHNCISTSIIWRIS